MTDEVYGLMLTLPFLCFEYGRFCIWKITGFPCYFKQRIGG